MNKTLAIMIAVLLVFLQQTAWVEAGEAQSAEQPATTAGAEPKAAADVTPDQKAPAQKVSEPITGAFGITLGEPFKPSMVARVISEQPQKYRRGDGTELEGGLIEVEPSQPDERFQRYAVKTTDKGLVYAIRAEYQFDLDQAKAEKDKKRSTSFRKTCKNAVKSLAKELKARYGEPRGHGWDGDWYAFRQISENTDKSLRLYANRCRSGIYSVLYTDQALLGIQAKQAKRQQKPVKEEPPEKEQQKEAPQEQKQTTEQQS